MGEDWFWHVLALALGGRTIQEWRSVMTQPEFLLWLEFYRMFPFDDLHRFHRPAALVAQSLGGGGDITAKLDWLAPDPVNDGLSDADMRTIRGLGFKRKGG